MSLFQLKNKLHLIANKSDKNIITTEQINASNEVTKSKTESNINNNKKKFPLNKWELLFSLSTIHFITITYYDKCFGINLGY